MYDGLNFSSHNSYEDDDDIMSEEEGQLELTFPLIVANWK